jgi:hypothetical protein
MYRGCMNDTQAVHKVTVNLIPKAWTAAAESAERLGLSRTDVINRALQAYAFLEEQITGGATILVRAADGTVSEVRFL